MELPEIMQLGKPLPQSIGRCADLYHDIREIRLAMEKEVAEIKARETEVQEHIVGTLSAGEDTGAAGLRYRAQVVSKKKPILKPEGWGLLTSWIRKNDAFQMLQKRINETAVHEWLEANPDREGLPGVEMINAKSLSVTKI